MSGDLERARRLAPTILFDEREPFFPERAGCTVFREPARSPSFNRVIDPDGGVAVEYAIWWDWDIGHLYELEHIWVYEQDGAVVRVEASAHGGYAEMPVGVPLLSEPGKHAFAGDVEGFAHARSRTGTRGSPTNALAGVGGVLVNDLFRGRIRRTPRDNTLVRSWLSRHAFDPAWSFTNEFDLASVPLVSWSELDAWIPQRVAWWQQRLGAEVGPDEYRPLRIGHRGAAAHAPDNSLDGIRAAAMVGADMVELDVRVLSDGTAILSHDEPSGGAHASLDEALALCRSESLGAYLELKDDRAAEAVGAAASRGTNVIAASFVAARLVSLRELAPRIPRSILFGASDADPLALAASCDARYVHPCWERFADPLVHLTHEWIARVRDAELGIVCWHEERPSVIARLKRLGVDGICSDAPELLV